MIKFIASDLDGTILQNKAQSVDDETLGLIGRLLDKGVLFAPASGRQIESLRKLFDPVADRLVYISENGAYVKYGEHVINKMAIDRKLALEMMQDVDDTPDCEFLVSGEHYAYIRPKTEFFRNRMTRVVNYETITIESFEDIQEDIIKVAVCDVSGIVHSKEHFYEKWGSVASVAVSGELFLDMTAPGVNKGEAIRKIREYFGLGFDECMAFGDNYNDVEMLENVGYSYAMDNAADEIKGHARFCTGLVKDVLKTLV
jgi:hypothetical protein